MSMKTIVRENKKAVEGKIQHWFCPYCSRKLSSKEVKELQCDACKNYLIRTLDGGLKLPEYRDK